MKSINKISVCLAAVFLTLLSCSEDKLATNTPQEKGTLRMSATFGPSTRLAELPNGDEMSVDQRGLKNVGLYIYYTEDYNNNDLTKPYMRNIECEVVNGELRALLNPGQDDKDAQIFIYNEMTIVAFYPYNASAPAFTTRADEEKYVITRNDYSQQYYIPYRAQAETNPTIAYYTVLTFYPKHTYKLEVVVVSDDANAISDPDAIQILPGNDPVGNANTTTDGAREKWWDEVNIMPDEGGGSNVWQFVTYLWTKEGNENNIEMGDILLQGGDLTLIASHRLTVDEQYVYRYGYNMSTGEIFIPTSSQIVHDIPSLNAINNGSSQSYQACDIELGSWTPISIFGGRFDGGGHKLIDMEINTSDLSAGLFGEIRGNATICNVNLVNPVITVNANNASVGGIAGKLGVAITDAEKQQLIGNLPPGLSPTVRQALIDEIMAGLNNTESKIVGCKVDNPTIVVNGTGGNVGTLCGEAGSKSEGGEFMTRIWDSYTSGGSISATNAANIGGFCGLNQGNITRSYTTTATIIPGGAGFANMGGDFTPEEGAGIDSSYSLLPDGNAGVQQLPAAWPAWPNYMDKWPVKTTSWLNDPGNPFWYSNGAAPSNYPILQWERK